MSPKATSSRAASTRQAPRRKPSGFDAVGSLEADRLHLRTLARDALGVTGEGRSISLRRGIRESGVGWYTLLALGVLVIVDEFQGYGFLVLGPEIAESLGLSKSAMAAVGALKTIAISLATLPMAAYVQRKARRASLSIAAAFMWAVMTLFTGFVVSVWGLVLVLLVDGASTGSVRALHTPLLVDAHPPEVRVRALTFYRGADGVGNIIAPLLVGLFTAVLGLTWRGVFLAMGALCLLAAAIAAGLRDPGFGRWDTSRIREEVRRETRRSNDSPDTEAIQLGFFEIVQRLLLIPTVRRVLIGHAVLGMLVVPFTTFLFFFLDERWNMGPGARGLFFAVMPIFAIGALAIFGPRAEDMFRQDPARLVRLAGGLLAGAVASVTLAVLSPVFLGMVVFFGGAFAMVAALAPALNMTIMSIIPPQMRPHAAAMQGIALAAVGGFGGLLLLGGIDRRYGTAAAMISLAVPGIAAGLVMRSASKTVNDDLDRMIDGIVEEEEVRSFMARGTDVPLLACRHIDFSYGQLQVLFDIDFTVDDGEKVALLGTNGAGKSTLLRVISGLGPPTRGTVRLRGADITYVDAERRLRMGIVQIPGGRSVFAPMTVVENLRLCGYSLGRDPKAIESAVDTSLDAFPRLAERRHQAASTLSGGEQQMLALATALILRPRLLLIDELSLGLAPRVVAELLEMIRRINAEGTAVVLVEQSVNVALSVVDHAYFMEKGEVRFDGRAQELLERPDLVRSVFLAGATQALPDDERKPRLRASTRRRSTTSTRRERR